MKTEVSHGYAITCLVICQSGFREEISLEVVALNFLSILLFPTVFFLEEVSCGVSMSRSSIVIINLSTKPVAL